MAANELRAATSVRIFETNHLAAQSFNHPRLRTHIEESFVSVAAFVAGRPYEQSSLMRQSPNEANRENEIVLKRQNRGYSVESHVAKTNADCQEIFSELRARILALDPGIRERAVKILVGYKAKHNFAEIHFRSDRLKIHLRPKDYIDPRGVVERLENPGYTMDRRFYISDRTEMNYAMSLIEQSYDDVPFN
jgi:predicted transport protein